MNAKTGTILTVFAILGLGLLAALPAFDVEYDTVTVSSKERVVKGDSSRYLIFTDKTTYEVTDSLVHWKFKSSDRYGAIQVGKKYRIKHAGWRMGFPTMYENILEAKLATSTQE